jgi:hypothetical protein
MAKINVLKPFRLNHDNAIREYKIGVHIVADEIAEHWYVKAHSEPVADAEKAAPEEGAAADQSEGGPEDETGGLNDQEGAPQEPKAKLPEVGAEVPPASTEKTSEDAADAEKAALKAEAEALGIDVDGRWGIPKLKAEIKAKKAGG